MEENVSMTSERTVAIIGLGYVGLPLAQAVARVGARVIGFDVNATIVDALKRGESHVDDLSDADVAAMVAAGFEPTTDEGRLNEADIFVVCVPTPLSADGSPDLTALKSASGLAARHLRPGGLVVLESTTFPGTTEEIVVPLVEAAGHAVGRDVHVAFSPERVDPGNPVYGIANTPKVVGGVTPRCTELATEFYSGFVQKVIQAKGTREAEMAKLLENTYRHINIALVNELAQVCHELGIDIWDVVACAATKPFGFQAFYPGPGVGGHCIPIDPNYLSYLVQTKLGYPLRFVALAQEINITMPQYVARRIQDLLNEDSLALKGAKVLLVGVTYKADIEDQRESPANDLAMRLVDQGADVGTTIRT